VGARGGTQGVGERLGGEGADETVPAPAKERGEDSVHAARGDREAELDERRERRRSGSAAGEAHGGRRSADAAVGVEWTFEVPP
jgi:hypothetical protein